MPNVVQVHEKGRQTRFLRQPQHPFQVRYRPWQIQPIFIAPILAGETLEQINYQARVVSDPIRNPLVGWWNETWFFYVKLRDLYERDLLQDMLMNPEATITSLDSATKVEHYHTNGTENPAINYVDMCLRRVVDEYFRREGETHATASIGNLPAAAVNIANYLDSAINDADYVTPADETLTSATPGQGDGTTAVTISEIDNAWQRYQLMLQSQVTDMTFEDYCRMFGVRMPETQELHRPELIRYIKEWTYPTNTIDPSNGTPRSAVSWGIQERADKARFATEPGFIFGVTVTRPKAYFANLTSNAVMLMSNAKYWMPPHLWAYPYASMRKVAAGETPLDANTDAYWVDIKDLFLYGDQFVNFALSDANANLVALPTAGLQKEYPSATDSASVFVDSAGTAINVKADGIVTLKINGHITDTTPQSVGVNKTV